MRDEDIKKILQHLNGTIGPFVCKIYKFQISSTVEYAKVWYELKPPLQIESRFFFIKNQQTYVGGINILREDLHWYVLKEERKNGYLTNALKNTILPFLFNKMGYEQVKISIISNNPNSAKASISVAEKVGFKRITEIDYLLYKDQLNFDEEVLSLKYPGIKKEEYKNLKNEIKEISTRLRQIHTQFEFSTGLKMEKYQTPTLAELGDIVALRAWSLQDMYHDQLVEGEK